MHLHGFKFSAAHEWKKRTKSLRQLQKYVLAEACFRLIQNSDLHVYMMILPFNMNIRENVSYMRPCKTETLRLDLFADQTEPKADKHVIVEACRTSNPYVYKQSICIKTIHKHPGKKN
jgi:hypothetical protein